MEICDCAGETFGFAGIWAFAAVVFKEKETFALQGVVMVLMRIITNGRTCIFKLIPKTGWSVLRIYANPSASHSTLRDDSPGSDSKSSGQVSEEENRNY